MITDDYALVPWIKRGDNFILGPYHFVCMGWENGRMRAARRTYPGIVIHSLSIDVALDPGLKIVERQKAKDITP